MKKQDRERVIHGERESMNKKGDARNPFGSSCLGSKLQYLKLTNVGSKGGS